jgi:ubiquinone/menaquinone biosynthesis C-methylase UbiE
MHEYFRNIWPNDPFITEEVSNDKLESISLCLKNCMNIIERTKDLGSYFNSNEIIDSFKKQPTHDGENQTQVVYGELWESLNSEYIINETQDVLRRLFVKGGLKIDELKEKKIIDVGCGSGRFTIALAQMGVKEIVGVDLGESGIKIGEEFARKLNLKNIKFIKNDILSLPFDDESFDFVFSKGVLHHTGNLEKGLDEYHRVMKKGGIGYLYLYGSGGIFWNSRKKMREVMKDIPMQYTQKVLEIIGMPNKRYVFVDSWYVPIEEYVDRKWLENYLSKKYSKILRVDDTGDININSMSNLQYSKEIWGDGELRYFISK